MGRGVQAIAVLTTGILLGVGLAIALLTLLRALVPPPSRGPPPDVPQAPRVPVFCTGGDAVHRRAHAIIRGAFDSYRTELSVRMKAIDKMLQESLTKWDGHAARPDISKAVRERAWAGYQTMPECWQVNEDLLSQLLHVPPFVQALPLQPLHAPNGSGSQAATPMHEGAGGMAYDDVVHVFTHLVRDWARKGAETRRRTYGPILEQARMHLRPGSRVLVPGAGLCRLASDLSSLQHHHVTALDSSIIMLSTAHTLLSLPFSSPPMSFHPYLHDPLTNQASPTARYQAATIDDLPEFSDPDPGLASRFFSFLSGLSGPRKGRRGSLSLEYGDLARFVSPDNVGQLDGVVTCFFIDTASNVLDYLGHIHSLLRPGGVWINLGPLQYHQALQDGSVQLSYGEVLHAAELLGFDVLRPLPPQPPPCAYRPDIPHEKEKGGGERGGLLGGTLRVEVYQPAMHVARKR